MGIRLKKKYLLNYSVYQSLVKDNFAVYILLTVAKMLCMCVCVCALTLTICFSPGFPELKVVARVEEHGSLYQGTLPDWVVLLMDRV